MVRKRDEALVAWTLERIRERQQVTSSTVLYWSPPGSAEGLKGSGRLHLTFTDNVEGFRQVFVDVNPILRGKVAINLQTETEAKGATRRHSKRAFMEATPDAVRKFAALLLEAADEADDAAAHAARGR